MKKAAYFFSLFLLGGICVYYILSIFTIKPKDIENYHQILKRKAKLTSCEELQRKPLFQARAEVQKDIFIADNSISKKNQRRHMRISSKNSEVTISDKKGGLILNESMKDIICILQDKIYFDIDSKNTMQKIRYFTAESGDYRYPSHKFTTDAIKLKFYEIPGDTLPYNIFTYDSYLKGFAKKVSFSLSDTTPELTASHFRASFNLEREIK